MPAQTTRLEALLQHQQLPHEVLSERRHVTALGAVARTRTPASEFAKAVILRIGDGYAMAVLAADQRVDCARFGKALGGLPVTLASEAEVRELCPDCEGGAVPPFGNLYGLQVYLAPALARCETLTLVGGARSQAMRLAYRDYEALVRPRRLDFCVAAPQRNSLAQTPARG